MANAARSGLQLRAGWREPWALANNPTGAFMTSRTTRIALILATLVSGLLAGFNLDRALVAMPAWNAVGAVAWAEFSRRADLCRPGPLPVRGDWRRAADAGGGDRRSFYARRAAACRPRLRRGGSARGGRAGADGDGRADHARHWRRERPGRPAARLRGILVLGRLARLVPDSSRFSRNWRRWRCCCAATRRVVP